MLVNLSTMEQINEDEYSDSEVENIVESELNERDCGYFPVRVTDVKLFDTLGIPPAMTLPGVLLFGDPEPQVRTIRHETIHYKQYKELGFVGFLPLYFLHIGTAVPYFYFKKKERSFSEAVELAYFANPFEREAYEQQCNPDYLRTRRHYAWRKFIKKSYSAED